MTKKELVKAVRLGYARQMMDSFVKDGFQAARDEYRRLENRTHEEGLKAAFAKGGAVAFLTAGFAEIAARGEPEHGADWLRIVLLSAAQDIKSALGVDLDMFVVGPNPPARELPKKRVGKKVVPRTPKTAAEKRGQLDVIRCALEAAGAQLRQLGFRTESQSLAAGAAAMEDLKKRVTR